MMNVAEYVKVGVENGRPVMGLVYRDETAEEAAERIERERMDAMRAPTVEERVDTLETLTDDIVLLMADMIGGM